MKPQGVKGCLTGNPTRGRKENPITAKNWNNEGYKEKVNVSCNKVQRNGRSRHFIGSFKGEWDPVTWK